MLQPNIGKFRLAVNCPRTNDGTSFYRCMGPLGQMMRANTRLELHFPKQVEEGLDLSWEWLAPCHALHMQRPFLPVHVQLCKLAKSMDLPIWIDWDDDHTCVRVSNPAIRYYNDPETIRQCRAEMIEMADVITVTTAELRRRIGPKAVVVPNALQHRMPKPEEIEPPDKRIAWRGSNSHDEDLAGVLGRMADLAQLPQHSRWKWFFMGDPSWEVKQLMPPGLLELHGGAGPTFWVPLMRLMRPYLMIVPLANHGFNRCKSNLAWIEATAAGAVTLAPDWEEWQVPGVIHYKDNADFAAKLRWAMEQFGKPGMREGLEQSRVHIEEHLQLNKVNQKRWEILNALFDKRPPL